MEVMWAVQIINSILMVLLLGFFGMVVYMVYLSIKALRIYINEHEKKQETTEKKKHDTSDK